MRLPPPGPARLRRLRIVFASPRRGRGNPARWSAAILDGLASLAMTAEAVGRPLLSAGVVALALAGCGSSGLPPPPEDPALARDTRLARLSFEQQRPQQAATLYRQALTQAQQRDDLPAIADLGWNLAVVLLRLDRPAEAAAMAQATRDEVTRRGGTPHPELLLVEAAALYRTGDAATAAAKASQVVADPQAPAATRGRAAFLSGLIAADQGDAGGIAAALASMDAVAGEPLPALAPDRSELAGRRAVLDGDPASAQAAFLNAADGRRTALDYPGMARALAGAAAAAAALGHAGEAADLWLRAGRSAQLGGQTAAARAWLTRAGDAARQAGASDIAAEAASRLAALEAGADGSAPGAAQPSRVPAGSG